MGQTVGGRTDRNTFNLWNSFTTHFLIWTNSSFGQSSQRLWGTDGICMPFASSLFTPSLSQCNPLESLCQYIEHEEHKHLECCDINVQLSRSSGSKNHHVSVSDPNSGEKRCYYGYEQDYVTKSGNYLPESFSFFCSYKIYDREVKV